MTGLFCSAGLPPSPHPDFLCPSLWLRALHRCLFPAKELDSQKKIVLIERGRVFHGRSRLLGLGVAAPPSYLLSCEWSVLPHGPGTLPPNPHDQEQTSTAFNRRCCMQRCLVTQCVRLFATPWPVARQAPLSIGFFKQEYWLPFPPPGDVPNPGIEPVSPALAGRFFTTELPGKPSIICRIRCNPSMLVRTQGAEPLLLGGGVYVGHSPPLGRAPRVDGGAPLSTHRKAWCQSDDSSDT